MIERKVGLLGAGNMGEALIQGLIQGQVVARSNLRASDPREDRLAMLRTSHGIETTADNAALVTWSDVVVLAVKPQVVPQVLGQVGRLLGLEKLLVSIAAGVPISRLAEHVPVNTRIVRAMPNTPAIVLAGATALASGPHATADDVSTARSLFEAVGRCAVLDEGLIDAATGLSGSGPAYVMLILEALADGGVWMGLPREVAVTLAAQTLYGAAKLQLETKTHPGKLKDLVTSPGGTTIAGVHALEAGGLRSTIMNAVAAATRRAQELGRDR